CAHSFARSHAGAHRVGCACGMCGVVRRGVDVVCAQPPAPTETIKWSAQARGQAMVKELVVPFRNAQLERARLRTVERVAALSRKQLQQRRAALYANFNNANANGSGGSANAASHPASAASGGGGRGGGGGGGGADWSG